jgi:hypothetical protein
MMNYKIDWWCNGSTSDFGSESSRFEPWPVNLKCSEIIPYMRDYFIYEPTITMSPAPFSVIIFAFQSNYVG